VSQPTSLLFSLEELAHMEEQRVRAQAEAAERERAAAEAASRQVLEQARAEQQAREEAAARRRDEAERLARSEAARAEAMRLAAVESARASVEASVRERERERARVHELEMARTERGRSRAARAAVAGAIGGVVAGAAIVASVLVPRMTRQSAEARLEQVAQLDAIGELRAKLGAADARMADLDRELAAERDAKSLLAGELDAARRHAPKTPVNKPPSHPGGTGDQPVDPRLALPLCAPGSLDPMCIR
jgi:hypothetical protein